MALPDGASIGLRGRSAGEVARGPGWSGRVVLPVGVGCYRCRWAIEQVPAGMAAPRCKDVVHVCAVGWDAGAGKASLVGEVGGKVGVGVAAVGANEGVADGYVRGGDLEREERLT